MDVLSDGAPRAFWTVSTDPSDHHDVVEHMLFQSAKRALALELLRVHSLIPPHATRLAVPPEDRPYIVIHTPNWEKVINRALGICDRSFLTSDHDWPLPTNKHACAVASKFDGRPIKTTDFFESARKTYRPSSESANVSFLQDENANDHLVADFEDLMESFNGKAIEPDAYGTQGGVVEMGVQMITHFAEAQQLNYQLIDAVKQSATSLAEPYIHDLHAAKRAVETMLETRPEHDNLLARAEALRKGHAKLDEFKKTIIEYNARKKKRGCPLVGLSEDCLSMISMYLDSKSAIALMRSSTTLLRCTDIALRVPHMRIRVISGEFPHRLESSYDRDLLMQNRKQVVKRNFVIKKKKVSLWIDFVQHCLREEPLKKKPRVDGVDNSNHDFSDDEYEQEPESPLKNRPVVEQHNTSTQWGAQAHKTQTKKQQAWDLAEGPAENVNRFVYNKRISYSTYFYRPLDISTRLVFADTLEPVSTYEFPDGIQHSNKVQRENGFFRQDDRRYTSHRMPAHAKLHVPLLSSEHGGRRFRILLTGSGTSCAGDPVTLKTYSDPFEVVSAIGTVESASKRRTAEEKSEQARDRELQKRRR
jgi:hypothetical protein